MNRDDGSEREDRLVSILAACDEALAVEGVPTPSNGNTVTPDQEPRLQRDLACVQLLRQLWPRGDETSLPPARTNSDGGFVAPGSRIGRFEIRHELGRGGFGVVHLAWDPNLGREVALKVPRGDVLFTPELRSRFQQEAKAAAGLDHPHLVQVHEAGEIGLVSYIASAYCPGVTLAHWIHEQTSAVPALEAARLVYTLADAVQHAHERGVLHRDLKPANVLLQIRDSSVQLQRSGQGALSHAALGNLQAAIPKIADFGLAKHLDASTEQTRSGAMLGTPAYMAPEQAEGERKAIGPGVDIYALGVILYELLTGRPPFQADSALATLMLIRREEPVPPSRLRPGMPRDLETVCLKCLQKEPGKRYGSARALAEDLSRFLEGKPIRARRVGLAERGIRWCRRKPVIAGLTAALVSVVVVGLAGVLWQWRRAEINYLEAKTERDTALREGARAERHLRQAYEAVERLTKLGEKLIHQPQLNNTAKVVLEEALLFHRGFLEEKSQDEKVRWETAKAAQRVAGICHTLGQPVEATQAWQQAIELLEGLAADYPGHRPYRRGLAHSYRECANVLRDRQQYAEADKSYAHAVEIGEALLKEDATSATDLSALSNALINWCTILKAQKRWDGVDALYARAIVLQNEAMVLEPNNANHQSGLALCLDDLGQLLWSRGRRKEAEKACREALAVREKLNKSGTASSGFPRYLARSYHHLGNMQAALKQPEAAEESLGKARDLLAKQVSDFPNVPFYKDALASTHLSLSNFYENAGRISEAGAALHDAVNTRSTDPLTANNLAWRLATIGDARFRDLPLAERLARRGIEEAPLHATHWNTFGVVHYRKGKLKEAAAAFEKSMQMSDGGEVEDWIFLGMTRWLLGEREQARQLFDRAVKWIDEHAPDRPELQRFRAEAEALLGLRAKS